MADVELDALLDQHGDFDAVVEAVVASALATEDAAERARLWRIVAMVHDEYLESPENAAEAFEHVCEAAPDDADAVEQLVRLYEQLGDREALANVLVDAGSLRAEPDGRARAFRDAARIFGEELGRTEEAQLVLRRALLEVPGDTTLWDDVEELWTRSGDHEALAELLADHAAVVSAEEGERSALPLLTATARAYRAAGNLPLAEAFLERAALLDEGDEEVLRAQVALHREGGDESALIEALERLVTAATGPELRVESGVEVARLLLAREDVSSEDARRARTALERASVDAPEDEEIERLLERALEQSGDTVALVSHLARRADGTDGAERRAILTRIADLQAGTLSDPDAAITTLRTVCDENPDAGDAIASLYALLRGAGRASDAAPLALRLADGTTEDTAWRGYMDAALEGRRADDDLQGALEVAEAIHLRFPDDLGVLALVEELRAASGDEAGVIAALRERVAREHDEGTLRSLHARLAELVSPTDPESACRSYEAILAIDPGHLSALAGLSACLERLERWPELAATLERRIARVRELVPRAALLARLADLREGCLGDSDGALAAREEAASLDPQCVAALRPLVASHVGAERWERAATVVGNLLTALGDEPSSADERRVLHAQHARALAEIGADLDAVRAWEAVGELGALDISELRTMAGLQERVGLAEDADRSWSTIVRDHWNELDTDDRVEVLVAAGRAANAVGDRARAETMFRDALEVDPDNHGALKELASVASTSEPSERARIALTLREQSTDSAERLRLALEAGELLASSGSLDEAIEVYVSAAQEAPTSKVVAQRLLGVYTDAGHWTDAASMLQRLVELEEDAGRREKLRFALGALYRDQLGDVERAARVFEALLDERPESAEALSALAALLFGVRSWIRLEQAYRRQLERLAPLDEVDDARFAIVMALGTLYRDELGRSDDAVAAFTVASQIRPTDAGPLVAIADTYPRSGKPSDRTIAEHRAVLAVEPTRVESLRSLFATLERERRFDEAWNVAAAATVVGERDAHIAGFYTSHARADFQPARRALARADWRMLHHHDLSEPATRLLAVLSGALRRVYSADPKVAGVNRRRDVLDTGRHPAFSAAVNYASQALGVAAPELYASPTPGIRNANLDPRALLVGTDLLALPLDRALIFRVTRAIALVRSEFYLASALTPQTLTAVFRATVSLFTGGIPAAWDSEPVRAWVDAIGRQPKELTGTVSDAVKEYVQADEVLNVAALPRAVELTAGRVALLMSGDLQYAARAIQAGDPSLGDLGPAERVLDLVAFSVSESNATLRAELGLGIGQA